MLSAANASLLPTLQFNYNSATAVFGSASTGVYPTLGTQVDTDFYWLPEGVAVEPPGLGTTRQWILQQLNPTIASASSARLQFPRLGGYLDTIVPEIYDDMYISFGGVTRPTGVIAFSRKTSLSQTSLGLLDTGEAYLSTNPGTLLEVNGAPWGTFSNGPATMSALVDQVVPTGSIIQGLPEV